MRVRRRMARYVPPIPLPLARAASYATRQALLRSIERVVGRPLREETLTWNELSASGRLSVGRCSFGRPTVYVHPGDRGSITIGSFVSIGAGVEILMGGNHQPSWVSTYPFRIVFDLDGAYEDGIPSSKGAVVIGHDVSIGRGSVILSGVHIGNGAVVGEHAVVSSSVRAYSVVKGNPAREVHRRFSDAEVEMLTQLAWWEWPLPRIVRLVPLLQGNNVDALAISSATP